MKSRLSERVMRISEKTAAGRDVLDLARERTAYVFDHFDRVVVSHSGGKDSIVASELALEEARRRGRLPLDVMFLDEEINYPTTREFFLRMRENRDVRLRWVCWNWEWRNSITRSWWWSWDPRFRSTWVFDPPPDADFDPPPGFKPMPMQDADPFLHPAERGTVGLITGMRADESPARQFGTLRRETDAWISPKEKSKYACLCKTVYDWKTSDVWTAISRFGWDYNHAYDLMVRFGIPERNQRIAQPFHDEGLSGIPAYAEMFPEWWDRVLARMPEAAVAARYARSPLFGRGGVFEKPDDVTWREVFEQAIAKWKPRERAKILSRLAGLRRVHALESGNKPIPESDANLSPVGLTWKYMVQRALRGALKDRDNATAYGKSAWRKKAKRRALLEAQRKKDR